jgi:hypothetical protein
MDSNVVLLPNGKDSIDDIELVPFELEILFHA